ncbi:MAG TPA: sigma-70 family RNA polymerase sigma factor [Thermoanaerobaculia bacterium]
MSNDAREPFINATKERNLLESLASGNEAAFWNLWRAHKPHLYEICTRIVTVDDAEDALSRSMLQARAKLPTYAREIVNLEAWLTRLAGNVCRDMLREQQRTACGVAFESDLVDSSSPEADYALLEIRVSVKEAIAGLPPRLNAAAALYFLDELPYSDVAEQLQITNENARKRVQQARALLRKALAPLFARA